MVGWIDRHWNEEDPGTQEVKGRVWGDMMGKEVKPVFQGQLEVLDSTGEPPVVVTSSYEHAASG